MTMNKPRGKKTSKDTSVESERGDLAAKALNEHGFPFQERCLHELKEKFSQHGWQFETDEYPVAYEDTETEIDFILKRKSSFSGIWCYGVFECKRAHPEHRTWLFASTPSDEDAAAFFATQLIRELDHGRPTNAHVLPAKMLIPRFEKDINPHTLSALEIDHRGKPTQRKSNTDSIRSACRQALTGVSGLIIEKMVIDRPATNPVQRILTVYIPIVVTTACLQIAEYDPSDIDLRTGEIQHTKIRAKEVGWVFSEHPLTYKDQSELIREEKGTLEPEELKQLKNRSVIIVNSLHMIDLLKEMGNLIDLGH